MAEASRSASTTTAFTCPLLENAKKHKCFLERLHTLGITIQSPTDKSSGASLLRYRHCWLPLVHQNPQIKLFPPPDIAWLWHCHRLAPMEYQRYCNLQFGLPALEANPPFVLQVAQDGGEVALHHDIIMTRQLWKQRYPNEPFFLAVDESATTSDDAESEKRSDLLLAGFDLLASTERQATFLWQVSGERFNDDSFLREGLDNYHKFLRLRSRAAAAKITLVPTYQIDLMWHTHILSSIEHYNKDCERIMGSRFHHDDSLTDRSEGSLLNRSFAATQELWREAYDGAEYKVEGGMYRGEPPVEYFEYATKGGWNSRLTPGAMNREWVGVLGASSTSPSVTQWAPVDGVTSDGSQAFIACDNISKSVFLSMGREPNYVLGKTENGSGYYHLETKDAHRILLSRVQAQIGKVESDISFGQCCCCYSARTLRMLQKQLDQLEKTRDVLKARLAASKPHGKVRATDQVYYNDTGDWLYPYILWSDCGGACGGTVAAASVGGSACGVFSHHGHSTSHSSHHHGGGGGDSGGWGGDGGGGGCGGGGCGGGGGGCGGGGGGCGGGG